MGNISIRVWESKRTELTVLSGWEGWHNISQRHSPNLGVCELIYAKRADSRFLQLCYAAL